MILEDGISVGFDAKRAFFNKSGLGNYSRDLIRILGKSFPKNRFLLFKYKNKEAISFDIPNNAITVLPTRSFHKKFGAYWRRKGISKEIAQHKLDIFHGLSQELPIGIEKTGLKTVVTIHDCIFLRYPELFDISYRIMFKRKYAHACRVADRIIAISEQTKKDIIHFFDVKEDKIDVVYQGCNPIFYDAASDSAKSDLIRKYKLPNDFMLTVGTIEPRKNVLSILEAMAKGNINTPLYVVGRPTDYLNKLRAFSEENNLLDKVFFLHEVETAELPAFYQLAKLFIYPSLFEGFGIPILEALNSGTPVITSSGSCFPEVGGKAADYVDYGNINQLKDSIYKIMNDDDIQIKMAEEGKKQALIFREGKIAMNIMNVYRKVLANKC